MRRMATAVATILIVAGSLATFSGRAAAHERRTVGPYQLIVGWLNEPALVGQLNSLDLRVTDTRTNQPVSGLEKTVTADVAAGGLAPFALTVSARFGQAGAYNGWVMPTTTGSYTFHIKGKIDTLDFDEKFESGPSTFGDVESTQDLQYPTKVPVADGLATQIDQLRAAADQARLIALVGFGLGLGGLLLSFVALTRRRA